MSLETTLAIYFMHFHYVLCTLNKDKVTKIRIQFYTKGMNLCMLQTEK